MAFEKRTWFARLGLGLNKFIIGEKDSAGKQELTNSPDSITQQGDVISADNLNDLENRIEAGFNGMKLTKIWENPNPTSSFTSQEITIDQTVTDVIIEYKVNAGLHISLFKHIKSDGSFGLNGLGFFELSSSRFEISFRQFAFSFPTSSSTAFTFYDGYISDDGGATINSYDSVIIPIAIYKVGDIYNS